MTAARLPFRYNGNLAISELEPDLWEADRDNVRPPRRLSGPTLIS